MVVRVSEGGWMTPLKGSVSPFSAYAEDSPREKITKDAAEQMSKKIIGINVSFQ